MVSPQKYTYSIDIPFLYVRLAQVIGVQGATELLKFSRSALSILSSTGSNSHPNPLSILSNSSSYPHPALSTQQQRQLHSPALSIRQQQQSPSSSSAFSIIILRSVVLVPISPQLRSLAVSRTLPFQSIKQNEVHLLFLFCGLFIREISKSFQFLYTGPQY
jgi:hypothetical protein